MAQPTAAPVKGAAAKATAQPSGDEAESFATLLDAKAAKATSSAKRRHAVAAFSSSEPDAASSQGSAHDTADGSAGTKTDASSAPMADQGQFVPPVLLPISFAVYTAGANQAPSSTDNAASADTASQSADLNALLPAPDVGTSAASTTDANPSLSSTDAASAAVGTSAVELAVPNSATILRSETHFAPEAPLAATLPQTGATIPPADADLQLDTGASVATPKSLASPATDTPTSSSNLSAASPRAVDFARLKSAPPVAQVATTAAPSNEASSTNRENDEAASAPLLPEPSAPVSSRVSGAAPSSGNGSFGHESNADSSAGRDQPSAAQTLVPTAASALSVPDLAAFGDDASTSSPGAQILAGIERVVSASDASQSSTAMQQPVAGEQQPPLKSLTLTLSPASLGSVDVELSLKNGQLDVTLNVEQASTAQLLRQDGSLTKLLESAGYALSNLTIHIAPQAAQPADANAQTNANGQNFASGFGSGGGGDQQAQQQSQNGQPADRNTDRRPGYARSEERGRSDSLYV